MKKLFAALVFLFLNAEAFPISYGRDLFAEGEFIAAGMGVNVRNCYPDNFLKLCLGTGLGVGYSLYFRNFAFNRDINRGLFYDSLNINAFISRDFWRLRLDFGYRLGLSANAVINAGNREYFYGTQVRMLWAISKQKVYVGAIALYGAFKNSNSAQSFESPKPTFILIPVSFIYVF